MPAPVLIIEPGVVNMPDMKAGQVYNGEFTVTNYGLIQVENAKLIKPQDTPNYKFEFLADIPDIIGAKQKLTVPYRITCLKTPNTEGGGSGGAGCWRSALVAQVSGNYYCANGDMCSTGASTSWVWIYWSVGCGGPGVPGCGPCECWACPGGGSNGGSSSGGGYIPTSGSPGGQSISGGVCLPKPPRKPCPDGKCPNRPTDEGQGQDTD